MVWPVESHSLTERVGWSKGTIRLVLATQHKLEEVEPEGCCNCPGVRRRGPSTGIHRRRERYYQRPRRQAQERSASASLIFFSHKAVPCSYHVLPPPSQNSSLYHTHLAILCCSQDSAPVKVHFPGLVPPSWLSDHPALIEGPQSSGLNQMEGPCLIHLCILQMHTVHMHNRKTAINRVWWFEFWSLKLDLTSSNPVFATYHLGKLPNLCDISVLHLLNAGDDNTSSE